MTNLITVNTLDPTLSLEKRTGNWVATLYNQAVILVEREHDGDSPEQAPWKLLSEEEKLVDAVEGLDRERRQWNIQYQNLVDEKALEIASGTIDSVRAAMANIIANRKRKRLRWQNLEYSQVKKVVKETLNLPPGSQGRQMASFIDNHLDLVEEAGVPATQVLTVLSKEDAFTIAASRAISRTQKMAESEEITEEERVERIQGIMELACTAPHASDVRKTYINGNKMKIPRDVITLDDETTLVTFVCAGEHEYSTLDRKTESISVQYGNANPILSETQHKRSRIKTIEDLNIIIGILHSRAELTCEQIQEYVSQNPRDILDMLVESGLVRIENNVFFFSESVV